MTKEPNKGRGGKANHNSPKRSNARKKPCRYQSKKIGVGICSSPMVDCKNNQGRIRVNPRSSRYKYSGYLSRLSDK